MESAQYMSGDYTQVLDDHGVLASVGSVGDAYDNALAESFVDSCKTELISDRTWTSRSQLELGLAGYLGWFNNDRLHESLGDIPPAEFEAQHAAAAAATTALQESEHDPPAKRAGAGVWLHSPYGLAAPDTGAALAATILQEAR